MPLTSDQHACFPLSCRFFLWSLSQLNNLRCLFTLCSSLCIMLSGSVLHAFGLRRWITAASQGATVFVRPICPRVSRWVWFSKDVRTTYPGGLMPVFLRHDLSTLSTPAANTPMCTRLNSNASAPPFDSRLSFSVIVPWSGVLTPNMARLSPEILCVFGLGYCERQWKSTRCTSNTPPPRVHSHTQIDTAVAV